MRRFFSGLYRSFKATGQVNSGGTLEFKLAGTSTDKNTYSDYSLSAVNSNPLTLNAQGMASIFLESGFYDVTEKDSSGSTVGTASNITDDVLTNTLAKSLTYTVTANDIGAYAGLNVMVETSATTSASAANPTILLPSASDLQNKMVRIVKSDIGTEGLLRVANSAGTVIWNGYMKDDYVVYTSDGTSLFRLGSHFDASTRIRLPGTQTFTASATSMKVSTTGWNVDYNVGRLWDATNQEFVAPYPCILKIDYHMFTDTLTPIFYSGAAGTESVFKNVQAYSAGAGAGMVKRLLVTELITLTTSNVVELWGISGDAPNGVVHGDGTGQTYAIATIIRRND